MSSCDDQRQKKDMRIGWILIGLIFLLLLLLLPYLLPFLILLPFLRLLLLHFLFLNSSLRLGFTRRSTDAFKILDNKIVL